MRWRTRAWWFVACAVALLVAGGAGLWRNAVACLAGASAIVLTNPMHLTAAVGVEEHPAWSPDGRMLAFSANSRGSPISSRWDICVLQAADSLPVNRTADFGGRNQFPSWSPDDAQIAHVCVVDGVAALWVTPAGGGTSRLVAPASHLWLDWAPGGTQIAFASQDRLWLASAAGDGPPRGLRTGRVGTPRWSPDGSRMYVAGAAEREGNFFVVGSDGTGEHAVTNLAGRRGMLGPNALATDGRYLYFTWEEDLGDLWVMDVGRRQRN